MHYFVPKRCVESNKIMYRDKATARQAADQSWRERGTELWCIGANAAEPGISHIAIQR